MGYDKGERVMLREYKCPKGLKPKLWKDRWTGPWKIVCRKSDVNYRISRGEGKRRRKIVVHHNRLKPYVQRPQKLEDTGSNKEKEDKLPNTTSFQSKELFWEDSDSEVGEEADVMPEGEGPLQRLSPPRREGLRN